MTAFVYVVECADGTLYTGWTTDVERRVAEHNAGQGARYTRGRGPVRLLLVEAYATQAEAMRREVAIKRLSRAGKRRVVDSKIMERHET
ncbi:MAG TPA: GIY-YIG nuclease family protein [Ardenticatenaceae bacterium]|nr:GIY-YIG nuclease family protein [Ardenticatenaceae bacterium]